MTRVQGNGKWIVCTVLEQKVVLSTLVSFSHSEKNITRLSEYFLRSEMPVNTDQCLCTQRDFGLDQ